MSSSGPVTAIRSRRCAAGLTAVLMLVGSSAYAQKVQKVPLINVVPITITSVTPQNGQLVANGLVGSIPFQAPLTLTPGAVPPGGTCPILNLSLGPIDLNLLGLQIQTSAICLNITAQQGGGLLGNLLCDIANLLQNGTPLSTILAGLNSDQLARLNNGLTSLLNQAVFIPLTSSSAVSGASCNVLNLSLGPLNLSLLGLNVALNNCANGPVTLTITANPAGGLLGQLLCNLANALNAQVSPATLLGLLQQIAAAIGQIVG